MFFVGIFVCIKSFSGLVCVTLWEPCVSLNKFWVTFVVLLNFVVNFFNFVDALCLFEAFLLYFGVVLCLWGQFLCLCVFLCQTVWITCRNTGFSSLFTQTFGPQTFGLNPKALFNNPYTMLSRQFWERVTGDTLWFQSTLNEMMVLSQPSGNKMG